MLPLDHIEAVFNSSTIPTVLSSPSDDPVFVAVNDAFLQTSTRSREELLGTRLFAAALLQSLQQKAARRSEA